MRSSHGGLGLAHEDLVLPAGTDPSWFGAVWSICQTREVALVVPVMEPELMVASANRTRLPAGASMLVSHPEAIQVCASKRKLAAALRHSGLSTPQPRGPAGPFPMFGRPDRGTGSRHATILRRPEDVARHRDYADSPVYTEFIDGPEISIDGFADRGSHKGAVARRRDEVRGGLAVRSEVVNLPESITKALPTLVRALGLDGFYNLQCRIDAKRGPLCFDLNPRLGGAMALSFSAGLDAPNLLLARAGLRPYPRIVPRVGTRLYRRWHNVILAPADG